MSPELIAILAIGVALASIGFTGLRGVRADLGRRIARLEGPLEGLREAISGRRTEAAG